MQRKTRGFQSSFGVGPIGSTLTSIKETPGGSSTGSHSVQSSKDPSHMSGTQNEVGETVQNQNSEVDLTHATSDDIFQIIEEECYGYEGEVNDNSKPNELNEQVHYVESQNENNHEERKTYNQAEEDDDAPIIYAHHDDDSISQITSSIAGNSMYSSDYMLSKISIPDYNINQKYKQAGAAGVAFSRTQAWKTNATNLDVDDTYDSARNSADLEKNTPLMGDEELDKFFGPSSSDNDPNEENKETLSARKSKDMEEKPDGLIDVNIYTTDETKHHTNDEDDDFTIREMYSMGSSVKNGSRRSFISSPQQRKSSILAFLDNARVKTKSALVKAKHTINRYLPRINSSNSQQKKDDDHDQNTVNEDVDYFSLLMGSNNYAISPNSPSQQKNKKEPNQVNLLWISSLLLLTWCLLYLAKIGNDSAWENRNNNRPGPMFRKQKNNVKTIVKEQLGNGQQNIMNPMNPNIPQDDPTLVTDKEFDSKVGQVNKGQQNIMQPMNANIPQNDPTVVVQSLQQNNDPTIVAQPQQQNNAPVAANPMAEVNVDTSHVGLPLPANYNNFMDVDVKAKKGHYIPFFWHVPRTAGATINEILGVCYHQRMASNAGTVQGHAQDQALQLIDVGAGHKYVNVDVSNSQGIQRAVSMGLTSSKLVDIVVSPLINESGQLFDELNQGRIFTMLRHPVERAVSLFYFFQDVVWKAPNSFNENLANIDISDFFRQRLGESNWQVRYLTNQVTKPFVDESDLKLAKEILRRKFVIGLVTDKEESFNRFQTYFGWKLKKKKDKECLKNKLDWDWSLQHPHKAIPEGSDLWNLIATHNQYDMQLYEYARFLFSEQSALF